MRIKLLVADPEPQPVATWQAGLFGGPCAESKLVQRPLFEGGMDRPRHKFRSRSAELAEQWELFGEPFATKE